MDALNEIKCLILAAGVSRRFGSNKLLHRMSDGRSLIETTIGQYVHSGLDVTVVTRQASAVSRSLVDHPEVSIVVSKHSSEGMSQSIVAGVKQCVTLRGWLIALADMPFVTPHTLRLLIAQARANVIVVPQTPKGLFGHPVFFGSDFYRDLQGLEGDVGARSLIQAHQDNVIAIQTDDEGIIKDVDTPEDLSD